MSNRNKSKIETLLGNKNLYTKFNILLTAREKEEKLNTYSKIFKTALGNVVECLQLEKVCEVHNIDYSYGVDTKDNYSFKINLTYYNSKESLEVFEFDGISYENRYQVLLALTSQILSFIKEDGNFTRDW